MSSQFSQSRLCQLYGAELEAVLQLSAHLTSPSTADLTEAVRALLTEAHVRNLVVDATVRVAVPARKRSTLLLGNPFVQACIARAVAAAAAAEVAAAAAQTTAAGATTAAATSSGTATGNGTIKPDAERREALTPTHRVGRIVALLPKPGSANGSTAVAEWLLAVHLGECTELFPLKAVSDEDFTEVEHQIYTQSAVGGAAQTALATTGKSTLLSGEQVEALKHRLVQLRSSLLLVRKAGDALSSSSTTATTGSGVTEADLLAQREKLLVTLTRSAARTRVAAGVGENEDKEEEEERAGRLAKRARTTEAEKPSNAMHHDEGEGPEDAHAVETGRLRDVIARQSVQLQELRQLLRKKESDVAAALQQQRIAEQQHAVEVGQLKDKAEAEALARGRGMKEAGEQLQMKDTKLQAAAEKLRSVAEMAAKYKRVYNELVTSALGFTPEEARTKKPEDVIALLKAKKSL